MTDPATRLMTALQQAFDRLPPLPAELAAPGLLLLVLWPALSVALPTPTEAFMTAFAIALAMRLALRSRLIILTARARLPRRATAALVLAAGPGLLALLLLAGDPLICQRFLSLYFLATAAFFLFDHLDGRNLMLNLRFPGPQARSRLLAPALVIFYLGLLGANETIIARAGLGEWLLFFGFLPLITHLVIGALLRALPVTVRVS